MEENPQRILHVLRGCILCYKHRIDVFELTRNLTDDPIGAGAVQTSKEVLRGGN